MRCLSCDKNLSDREAVRKYASTGEFLDLCDRCYDPIKEEVAVVENHLLSNDLSDDALADKFLYEYEKQKKGE